MQGVRRWIWLGVAALGLVAAGSASAGKRVSKDPFTNSDSQHATEVEADTFAYGSTIVSAFQAGRFFDGGASDIGFATSVDGGSKWVHGFLPSLTVNGKPAGPYARATDAAVAYDVSHGAWLVIALGLDSSGTGLAVEVSRSTDGGLTWAAPVTVATTNGFFDKTWIVCDNSATSPHFGNCYATWDDVERGDVLLTSVSQDGALTWGQGKTTQDVAAGLGGQPLVNAGGDVVVPALSAFADAILAYTSSDGGGTWSASTTVSDLSDHEVAGDLRSEPLPSADMDASGKTYVVWHDCRFRSGCSANDIVMSTSADGRAWTSPVRIPIDPVSSTVDHFIPGLAVDHSSKGRKARLALIYYFYPKSSCTASTCQLEEGFVSSIDGGKSWSAPQTLAGPMKLTDLANTDQGYMVGDYQSVSFSGKNAVTVFASAKPAKGSVLDEAMFSASIPVTKAQAYPLRVGRDAVLSPRGDRPIGTHSLSTP